MYNRVQLRRQQPKLQVGYSCFNCNSPSLEVFIDHHAFSQFSNYDICTFGNMLLMKYAAIIPIFTLKTFMKYILWFYACACVTPCSPNSKNS